MADVNAAAKAAQAGSASTRHRQARRLPTSRRRMPSCCSFAVAGGRAAVRRQLRRLPRPRRAGQCWLPEPERRRLDVGRFARRDPQDASGRHPQHRITPRRGSHGDAEASASTALLEARRRSTMWRSYVRSRRWSRRPISCRSRAWCQGDLHRAVRESVTAKMARASSTSGCAQPDDKHLAVWQAARRRNRGRASRTGRGGIMPAWSGPSRSDDDQGMLTVYVHSLGGGKPPRDFRLAPEGATSLIQSFQRWSLGQCVAADGCAEQSSHGGSVMQDQFRN
jgi:hypothetical protein